MGLLGSGPGSRYNPLCLWGLLFLSCNWATENNPLLVKSPLFELHTHTQHDYIWLNSLGNQARKWPVFSENVELQKSSVFRDYLDNGASGPPEPDRGEWKDALNFLLFFPLCLTDIQSGKENAVHTELRDRKQSTKLQLSNYLRIYTKLQQPEGDPWVTDLSCSFANKECMNYHL